MGRYCAKSASTETSAVHVDRMANHFVGRNPFPFIARMRQSGVRQIERRVYFFFSHWREHRIDFDGFLSMLLPDDAPMPFVGLYFDELEIFGLASFVAQALFERVQDEFGFVVYFRHLAGIFQYGSLLYVVDVFKRFSGRKAVANFQYWTLAHSIYDQFGGNFEQNGRFERVAPIIIVRQSAQGSFNASCNNGYVGI